MVVNSWAMEYYHGLEIGRAKRKANGQNSSELMKKMSYFKVLTKKY